jgi:hypothetical protein
MTEGRFSIDRSQMYFVNKAYLIKTSDLGVLSLLNSRLVWFWFIGTSVLKRGGYYEATTQHIELIPIPQFRQLDRKILVDLGELCTDKSTRRYDIQASTRHRILDLAPPERKKLSRKLEEWWTLDFAAFRDEVKRVFKNDIPVKERGEWESYLSKNAAAVKKLDAEIERAEREIDSVVYRLFDLTPEEIALLEQSIAGQH